MSAGTGAICTVRYSDFEATSKRRKIQGQVSGAVTVLEIHDLGGRPVVIAGSVDGSAAAWRLECVRPLPLAP